ncbi:MAG: hypothetical protein CMH83_09125 [Nocardioides sp.]|nr:hypothetical protein [Nocardioides sp.]
MTSLLPSPRTQRRPSGRPPKRVPGGSRPTEPAARRPLVLVATAGGVLAALSTLALCLVLALVGWYLTDAGSYGAPRDALRTGALGWLTGHGSGIRVEGVPITAVPLGITLLSAWALWRTGLRVGVAVSGHGPDADGIVDGERDLVVPLAVTLVTAGYVVSVAAVATLAATPATAPSTSAAMGWSVLLCLAVAGPAVTVGSGRAAVWLGPVPSVVLAGLAVARRTVLWWCAVSFVALLAALAVDLDTAANVLSQLGVGPGLVVLLVVLTVLLLPNATLFSGAYLLGPGFTVGTGTLVSTSAVVLGPLPSFPLLAALPADGTPPAWTGWLVALAPLVAALATARTLATWHPDGLVDAAVRGLAGGVVAGVAFGLLASLAGGAVGPGRMRDVAPYAFDALLHGVASFGLGGVVGALALAGWQRWRS